MLLHGCFKTLLDTMLGLGDAPARETLADTLCTTRLTSARATTIARGGNTSERHMIKLTFLWACEQYLCKS